MTNEQLRRIRLKMVGRMVTQEEAWRLRNGWLDREACFYMCDYMEHAFFAASACKAAQVKETFSNPERCLEYYGWVKISSRVPFFAGVAFQQPSRKQNDFVLEYLNFTLHQFPKDSMTYQDSRQILISWNRLYGDGGEV
jgi:hypothetical protein